ncbi:MAG: cytochrome c3 family protein [bacterium]|nr:cytochrome c3 family protein [bacterium]
MRKILVILAAAALLAIPMAASAGVALTSHDMSLAYSGIVKAGVCSPCHLPHGTQGDRLFPDPGAAAGGGIVGNLCAACHFSGGAYAGVTIPAQSDDYVYGTYSHGDVAQMTYDQYPDNTANGFLTSSALPYVSDAAPSMECTSCHNVHNDANRPFLRTDLDAMCGACHPNRHYDATTGFTTQLATIATWGPANTRLANPGSHPVGTDVDALLNDASQTIAISADFQVGLSAVVDGWNLGGHLSGGATGGVVCVTCHAVHGAQGDADDNLLFGTATAHTPYSNFLNIDQSSTALAYVAPTGLSRSVASGFGVDNAFCEACHNGTESVDYTVVGGAVDPGATGYTHPLDGITPSNNGWVTVFPANWPQGDATTFATGMTPVAICESCHVMHPTANAVATVVERPDVVQGAVDYAFILRDSSNAICNNCHTGSIAGHHPANVTFNPVGVPYLENVAANLLTCRTCHSSSGAHNWASADGIGLDPDWLPVNNGRDAVPATDAANAQMGQTCFDCHFNFDDAPHWSPVLDGAAAFLTTIVNTDSPGYTKLGDGTHFMGHVGAGEDLTATGLNPQLANVYTAGTAWTGVDGANATAAGWSRFRPAVADGIGIVCESCHELEPDKNNFGAATPGNHLLLATFTDGNNGNEAAEVVDGRDDFCQACHMPVGTHPMTGDTVGRTNGILDIVVTKAWLEDIDTTRATLEDVTWAVATDSMSCDSCHQVHDAETDSANMILEAQDANIPVTAGAITGANDFVPNFPDANKGPNHEAFCQYCHLY